VSAELDGRVRDAGKGGIQYAPDDGDDRVGAVEEGHGDHHRFPHHVRVFDGQTRVENGDIAFAVTRDWTSRVSLRVRGTDR
jgi:hypothetical protein